MQRSTPFSATCKLAFIKNTTQLNNSKIIYALIVDFNSAFNTTDHDKLKK